MEVPKAVTLNIKNFAAHASINGAIQDDFPFSGPLTKELSKEYGELLVLATSKNRITRFANGTYIFVPRLGHWTHIRSQNAMKYVAEIMDLKYVSVNFDVATDPYVSFLENIARPCNLFPKSVCMGTWRLAISMASNFMKLNPVSGIAGDYKPRDPMFNSRISGMTINPLSIRIIPRMYLLGEVSRAEQVLSNVLTPEQLKVLMWVIGNGLIDPIDRPKTVYLYGNGGDGKSVTINTIINNLPGCVFPLSTDYVGSNKSMKDVDITQCLSARFITHGDVELNNGKINSTFWKVITGGDTIRVAGGQGKLKCTGIFASNQIWFLPWFSRKEWFTRRSIVLTMNKPPKDADPPPESYSEHEIYNFIMNCLAIRMQYDTAPITLSMAFVTMFGSGVGYATVGVELDEDSNDMECLVATWYVTLSSGMDKDTLLRCIYTMNPDLLLYDGSDPVALRGIKPSPLQGCE